jgi:EAL domain-containing protein (putative c-di-GMP-specific phosphodiesterase class I)/GGDEF domain-containing protein
MVTANLPIELIRMKLETPQPARLHLIEPVTNLPNRREFLGQALRFALRVDDDDAGDGAGNSGRPDKPNRLQHLPEMTLFMITLADARHYNEILRALGHDFADAFVRAGAARLQSVLDSVLDEAVPLYHVSVLSLVFVAAVADPVAFAGHLARQFRKPLVCQNIPINNQAGIGLVTFNIKASTGSELLRAALTAAQKSRMDRNGWSIYDRKSDNAHQRAFTLLLDFPKALTEAGQLSLQFQPKVDLLTGRCIKAEALLRWDHPVLGRVPPGEFIPLLEATALIHPLTHWVAESAIKQLAVWRRKGLDLSLSINVSPPNFAHNRFSFDLIEALGRYDLPGPYLEVEITEGALTTNYDAVKDQLAALHGAGITTAVDDFGIGFSNLSNLAHLPMNTLKLDQSLIRRIADDSRSALLVHNVIDMAHGLNYRVVAEGIETATTYQQLREWGCDEGQGYFMSRPLDGIRFIDWLRTRRDASG